MDGIGGDTYIMREPIEGDDGNDPLFNVPTRPIIEQLTSTSIEVNSGLDSPTITYIIQRINPTTKADIGSPTTVVRSSTDSQVLTALIEGATYSIKVRGSSGASTGNTITFPPYTLTTTYASSGLSITNLSKDPKALTSAKSYLELSYPGKDPKKFVLAYKSFNGVNLPTSTQASTGLPTKQKPLARVYSNEWYSFGTSLFMENNEDYPNQMAGMGFFLDGVGKKGYAVLIESTASSAANSRKSVRIVKFTDIGIQTISSSQKTAATTFDGVFGGKAYFLDVKVKVSGQAVYIRASINGFKINATDVNNFTVTTNPKFISPPSQKVGAIVMKGKATFDYIYATSIDEYQYDSSEYNLNFYQGQFSDDTVSTAYGNLLYNANNNESDESKKKVIIEEFGSVVREIVRVKPRFNSRPAFPVKWSTGGNKFAKIIGQKISSFGGEAFVLNNTSTTIPLSDGAGAALYVFGNDIAQSGTLEYSTDEESSYGYKEPVIFQSNWLQNENDVKSLADWIKSQVVNRGRVVNMKVFGNPLINVGDIVGVKYTYQGFAGTEKLIVTSVSHSYNEGLETEITCRTL